MAAPNGANHQRWRFLVVKDAGIKRAVQKLYQRAFDEFVSPMYARTAPSPGASRASFARQHELVRHLTEHLHEAPVWIVPCLDEGTSASSGLARAHGASIYPAVQNMLLAARALGLGATLTTRHLLFEKEAEAALGLPAGVHSYAIIPLGFPVGRFGPVRRGPLTDVVYEDQWGRPYGALSATRC
jgi:nitroreductase